MARKLNKYWENNGVAKTIVVGLDVISQGGDTNHTCGVVQYGKEMFIRHNRCRIGV